MSTSPHALQLLLLVCLLKIAEYPRMLTWPRAHTACTIIEGKVQNGSESVPIVIDELIKNLCKSLLDRVMEVNLQNQVLYEVI
jgi:hypothetical protein